ncbi:MAG: transglutaminase [Hyphomicrobium sp. 32-62-53]|nr:MAG: transglutaminase [Hyphomicrobium sp. 12-62-95]OYX98989.1 MAG: transglutaminase [Hyphomicrobium sp. 32-62-53]
MKCVAVIAAGAAFGAALATQAVAEPKPRPALFERTAFMRVFGSSQPPYGFVRFCEQNPQHCVQRGTGGRFEATPESLSDLDEVNRIVNRSVEPATDAEIYGISEYWTLPGEKGDCEDYALLKQKILIGRGWPSSSLLLTVVRDEKGEGHAVLTARTSQGDFVLDNKSDDVRLWARSSYQFVMRQSYLDPKVWVSLDPQDAGAPAALAGVQDGH